MGFKIFWESNVCVRFHTKADYERSIFDIDDHHHILDDYNSDSDENHDNEYSDIIEPKEDFSLRIFYCSRTHSQLAQFVKEIQKTEFAADIRLVSLASRSNMCINDSVLSLKNNSMINERCLELQKKKPKLVLGESCTTILPTYFGIWNYIQLNLPFSPLYIRR